VADINVEALPQGKRLKNETKELENVMGVGRSSFVSFVLVSAWQNDGGICQRKV
jgi:hypothetical protein